MRVEILEGRRVDIVKHELDDDELHKLTVALAEQGIHVEPVVDALHTLHLNPKAPMTTEQEVAALRAFAECTDCRIDYHDPRPPVAPSCLLCGVGGGRLTHELCDGCRATFDQEIS